MATLCERLPELLRGVNPAWPPFFEKHRLTSLIKSALHKAEPDAGCLIPAENLIFEFLRYFGPDEVLILIVGQDLYPQDAQGIEPLRVITDNLERAGLARPHFRVEGDPSSGRMYSDSLRTWAAQGVLLMNTALTNQIGVQGKHQEYWKEFISSFIRVLLEHTTKAGKPPIHMLWGNDARSFASDIGDAHHVYHWTHPSPQIDNRLPFDSKFRNAPHFTDANVALRARSLRPIEWDPLSFTRAFTDGSCPRNGKTDAEASFAVFIHTGPLKNVEVAGRVAPHEYLFVDETDPLKGFVPNVKTNVTPTNNRGEYLAWCWVLLLLLRGGVRGRVEIVSDCNLFIQTMKDWLPSRRTQGKEKGLKNFDLILIAERLLKDLRDVIGVGEMGVQLIHVNSHQKCPSLVINPRAYVMWYGNDRVDRIAGTLLKGSEKFRLDTNSPVLNWYLHGRFV